MAKTLYEPIPRYILKSGTIKIEQIIRTRTAVEYTTVVNENFRTRKAVRKLLAEFRDKPVVITLRFFDPEDEEYNESDLD